MLPDTFPGPRIGSSGLDPRFDQINVRGFETTMSADFLDGLRQPYNGWLSIYGVEAYTLERIEVLKGPASVLYGQISPGGMVNRVSKRPSLEASNEVDTRQAHVVASLDCPSHRPRRPAFHHIADNVVIMHWVDNAIEGLLVRPHKVVLASLGQAILRSCEPVPDHADASRRRPKQDHAGVVLAVHRALGT